MDKFIASFSLKVKPERNDKFICINSNREILLDSVNSSFLHDVNERSLLDPIQIFTHGDSSIFLIRSNDVASNLIFLKKKEIYPYLDESLLTLLGRALQINDWVFFQNFCARHGHKLSDVNEDLSKNCPECRHDLFPKMSPCILVAVTYEDKILLVKHNNQIRNLFTVIAGFVELGESLEECVMREVKEEVGIDIDSIEYVGSQSWPFPNQLMIAFSAKAKSQDCEIDTQELLEAQWFAKNDLPTIPPKPSLSNYLIKRITDYQI